MFTADFKEKTAQVLPLPEKKASEIREMLLVIYPTSAKQIDENNYYFLLNLAQEYMMKMLFGKCEEYLMHCLNWPRQSPVLCLDLLDVAQEYRLEKLEMLCIDKARKLRFRELKNASMYAKINLSNFQQIVEAMIQQLESDIQQLERELDAVEGKVRKLQSKFTEVESHASSAIAEVTELASILVHQISTRNAKASTLDPYHCKDYVSTDTLSEKLSFIKREGGFWERLSSPLYALRKKLELIKDFRSSV